MFQKLEARAAQLEEQSRESKEIARQLNVREAAKKRASRAYRWFGLTMFLPENLR